MVAHAYHTFITPEEYLVREQEAETKSEYFNGHIYAMAGASRIHVVLTVNATGVLHGQLRGKSCQPLTQDMRLQVNETGLYTYPDLTIACEPLQFDEHDSLLNPVAIIEVLSPSTEAYDRGDKFAHYRRLPSLHDYVLIAQDKMRIEHFQRQPDGNWLLHIAEAPAESVELASCGCRLMVSEVYERVTFDEAASRAPLPSP